MLYLGVAILDTSKQLSSFPPIFVPPPHLNSLRHILPWNDPWLCHSSKLPPITLPWPLTILGASHDIDTHVCVWVPRCRSSGRCCASWILALFSTSTPDLMFHLDRLNEAVLGHCGLDFCGTNKRALRPPDPASSSRPSSSRKAGRPRIDRSGDAAAPFPRVSSGGLPMFTPQPRALHLILTVHFWTAAVKSFGIFPTYYLLDPTRIPSSEELEASAPDTIYAIKWGVFVVGVLFDVQVPPGAGVDLWPRVWSWVNFELLFHSVMGQFGVRLPSEAELCVSLITFSGELGTHEPTHQVIATTPGLQAFVVRAWVFILRANSYDTEARNAVIGDIFGFLDPTCFDEIIAGAGGTLQDLVAVVTAHLNMAILDLDETLPEEPLSHLGKVLNFTVDFDKARSPLRRPLCSALIDGGLMETITRIARAVIYGTQPVTKAVLDICLVLLCDMLLIESGYRKLREAIHAGLLLAVLRGAQRNVSSNINRSLLLLLVDILPAATVNCNVLADIGTAHMALEGPFSAEGFDPEVWNAWNAFSETLLERLDVLRTFDTRANVSLKACDNMDCNIIKEKIQLRRCSGCRDLLYCSRECQRFDWGEGGHRDQCVVHRTQRIDIELASTPRERAFMRALLHHDYLQFRTYLRSQWVKMWAADPDIKCSTLFDYRMGYVKIQVGNLPPVVGESKPELHESYWTDIVCS
ncbi:hypothetical protein DFH06DRAFT_1467324 [Mycena polygramma]|nr:hypothetical protein DFH06DRAFT_1467324 [Mycena polygramma]